MSTTAQIGHVVLEVDCIGRLAVLGIAIRRKEEVKIQTLVEAVKRGLIQNNVVAHSYPVKMKLGETDFKIMKCLISDARTEISEIAKKSFGFSQNCKF